MSVRPLGCLPATHCAQVAARASELTLDPIVSAVIRDVIALESGIYMPIPVRAVDGQALNEIAEPDDLWLTATIALDDDTALTFDPADAGNDNQLREPIARLVLPS